MDIRTSKPCTGVSINSTDTWLGLTVVSPRTLYFLPSVWGFFASIFVCFLFFFLFIVLNDCMASLKEERRFWRVITYTLNS